MGRRAVTAIRGYASLLFGLGLLGLVCLGWAPLATLLRVLLPEPWGRPLGRRMIMAGCRGYLACLSRIGACRFDLAALDSLRAQGPLIIAANHPSLLDAIMVLSRLPDVACIFKAPLMHNILFGPAARLARYIANDAPLGMIEQAVEELRRGSHLLIFPEGTRTRQPPINPCKGSLGLIARRAAAPVQTLLIETDSAFLGKTWPLLRRPTLPVVYRLRLGKRFDPPGDLPLFTAELERYFVSELG